MVMQKVRLYGAISLAMLFWSFSFIWTRQAIVSFQPVTLVTFRLVIASVLLFLISKASGKFQLMRREDVKWFLLLAFFEPFMYYIGETYGLTMVESTLASVIISTIPLFAPILAFFLLKEKISFANIAGIIVSLSGVFLVIYEPKGGFAANPWGIVLMFLAVFSAICYTTTLRKISTHYSTVNVIFYQSLVGLLYFIPTFFITDFSTFSFSKITSEGLFALLMLAVFASVIAFVLFAGVVRKIGVARTNVFVNLIPVFTAILAWWLLNEQLNGLKFAGIAITVVGLFVSQLGKFKFKFKLIRGTEY
jgi:drug/metabolite transporter (DMT)-like permease